MDKRFLGFTQYVQRYELDAPKAPMGESIGKKMRGKKMEKTD